jgi:hypothetical protein
MINERLVTVTSQACVASHQFKSTQSHDFDFLQISKKVKDVTLT